jgi:hypothetical protein
VPDPERGVPAFARRGRRVAAPRKQTSPLRITSKGQVTIARRFVSEIKARVDHTVAGSTTLADPPTAAVVALL